MPSIDINFFHPLHRTPARFSTPKITWCVPQIRYGVIEDECILYIITTRGGFRVLGGGEKRHVPLHFRSHAGVLWRGFWLCSLMGCTITVIIPIARRVVTIYLGGHSQEL